jgi:hypothetical protein
MDITAQDGDANGELGGKRLELVNQKGTFFLVSSSGVVIVQIIQQVHASVKRVEKATTYKRVSIISRWW